MKHVYMREHLFSKVLVCLLITTFGLQFVNSTAANPFQYSPDPPHIYLHARNFVQGPPLVAMPEEYIDYTITRAQENVTIKGNVTQTGLSNSSHSLTVYAKDTAGNTGTSETIYFSVTQQEPFPTLIAATTVIVAIAVIGAALLTYFVKARKARGKTE